MNDYVIFTSVPMCIALAFIVLIHIFASVISTVDRSRLFASPVLLASVAEGVGILLHLLILVMAFIKGASINEMLLVLMISGAAGIVSMGIAERIAEKNKNSKD